MVLSLESLELHARNIWLAALDKRAKFYSELTLDNRSPESLEATNLETGYDKSL